MVKQARAWQTRERVLDAAAGEFAVHGYEATKLQDVIARTDVTKGALYGHFESKRRLAAALVDESTQHWKRIRDACAAGPPSAQAALTELIRGLGAEFDANIRFRAAFRLAADFEPTLDDSDGLFSGIRNALVASVRGAQQEMDLTPPYPPESLAYLILAVLYGASYMPAWGVPQRAGTELDRAWRVLCTVLGI